MNSVSDDDLIERLRNGDDLSSRIEAADRLSALSPRVVTDEMDLAKVPEGQTPLVRSTLDHRFLEVIREGSKARDDGTVSPYHGHSLEHCLHATGWVQRDLRLALDKSSNALSSAGEKVDE